jgi:hypothetical protein
MKDIKNTDEILATIERRFQFVIVLALFLPFVWDNFIKAFPSISIYISHRPYLGIIITYIFLVYFLFEFSRKEFTEKTLNVIAGSLLFLSYSLIILIGLTIDSSGGNISGWKFTLIEIAILGNIILPPFILIFVLVNPSIDLLKSIIKVFKNSNKKDIQ